MTLSLKIPPGSVASGRAYRFSHFEMAKEMAKEWRKWRALPAENLANKVGIPTFEIGNVEACSHRVEAFCLLQVHGVVFSGWLSLTGGTAHPLCTVIPG
jgi:hypothetical protein